MLGIQQFKRPQVSRQVFGLVKRSTALTPLRHSSCCHKKKEQVEDNNKAAPITSSKFWSDPLTWQRTRVNTLRYIVFFFFLIYIHIVSRILIYLL